MMVIELGCWQIENTGRAQSYLRHSDCLSSQTAGQFYCPLSTLHFYNPPSTENFQNATSTKVALRGDPRLEASSTFQLAFYVECSLAIK